MVVSSCCFSDVSVTSQTQGCLGGLNDATVMYCWCFGDVLVQCGGCLDDVSVMSRSCRVWAMSREWRGDVSVRMA